MVEMNVARSWLKKRSRLEGFSSWTSAHSGRSATASIPSFQAAPTDPPQ